MSIRNLQPDNTNLFDNSLGTIIINTPLCKSYHTSTERGQDSLACSRCHIIRKLLYDEEATTLESPKELSIFQEILIKFPFIECLIVKCGTNNTSGNVVIPLRKGANNANPDLVESKLKEQFLLRKSRKLVDRRIERWQIYYRQNFHHIILPSENTEERDEFGGDEGVEFVNGSMKITNFDKMYKSGKYMYLVNYHQAKKLIYGEIMSRSESMEIAKHLVSCMKSDSLEKAFKEGKYNEIIRYCRASKLALGTQIEEPSTFYEVF